MSAGVVVDSLGSVVIAGYTKSFPSVSNSIRTWMLKTDSIGNIKWHKTYNGAWGSGSSAARIASLPNGNLIVAGGSQTFGNSNFGVDGTLMEIDTAGNVVWAKEYEVMGGQGLWGVVGLDDGTIVSCGVTDGPTGSQAGWLIKTDANGDTLWTHTYDSSDLIDYLRNMIVLPNGDIVMVGHGRPEGQTNQDGWILRVDSMGCLLENCVITGVNDELGMKYDELRIWPNPASDVVNIEFTDSSTRSSVGMTVRVVDMLGRASSPPWKEGSGEVKRLDVSQFPNGIYLITVTDQDGNSHTERLVVQH